MTTPAAPDLIHVTELVWGEQHPHAAHAHVTLTADRLFSGGAALAKAEELRRLVIALGARGLPESAVMLVGASLDVSTGLWSRSSAVTYRLRIEITDLDRVPDVLDVLAASKQARMERLTWDYDGDPHTGTALLATCAARALARARALATALGVDVRGVHAVHEELLGDVPPPGLVDSEAGAPMPRARAAHRGVGDALAGLELAPRRRIGARVKLACHVAPAAT